MATPFDLSPIDGLGLPETDIVTAVTNLAKTAFGFLGTLLVIMIIYGGLLYMVSGGNEEAKKKAMGTIKSSILGFVLIMLAPSIASYVLGALTANTALAGN